MRDELMEAVARALADLRGYGISNQDRRNAQAALAVIEARGMLSQGWQDIASAPRDGTQFLAAIGVYVKGVLQREVHLIWCDDETGDVHMDADYGWQIDDYEHWMPLPAPPVAAAEGGE